MADISHKHKLGFFQIVMINIIAVGSIRTLPFAAKLGFSSLFYFSISALLFFLPSALVSAELGTGWPKRGGLYVWIREAFGKRVALIAIWFNWIYNIVWYPTIMALIAGVATYLFDPTMVHNKLYMILTILALFWLATYLNCQGIHIAGWVSTVGALVGTLFPIAFIIVLGIVWLSSGNPSEITFTGSSFLPSVGFADQLGYFSMIIFGLVGLEMVATHAQEMKNPTRDYPKSILVSAIIILFAVVAASLAIAVVVPNRDLNIVVGIIQAFTVFFNRFHIPWMIPIITLCIVIGSLSSVSAWIAGPTKGLLVASRDGHLPSVFTQMNKHNAPVGALIIQAVLVSVLSLAFVFLPSVTSTYYLLSIITAQLAMIVYAILFAASIKLHHHKSSVKRPFKIPGKSVGIWLIACMGISISLFAIGIGFIPPKELSFGGHLAFESIIILGIVILGFTPIVLSWRRKTPSSSS